MIKIPSGILLPTTVLTSSWFIVLATAVAFNTIIYLGLTLSKLIPWPHQLHPDSIRRILRRGPQDAIEEGSMNFPSAYDRPESDDPYVALRLQVTRSSVQQGFALIGGLILVLSILSLVFVPDSSWIDHVFTFGSGAIFLGLGLVSTHRASKTKALIVTWVVSTIALSGLMLWLTIRDDNPATLAYLLVMLVALPQVTLGWRPFLVSGISVLVMLIAGTEFLPTIYDVQWIVAGVGALLAGGILLRTRLISLDAITEQTLRADFVASTDPLTGVMSRQGLATLLPGLGSLARRNGQLVAVALIDINDLARANNEYGLNYGDDVLRAVANAIKESVRTSDYVARWDGDSFLVVGMSNQNPPTELFKSRIEHALIRSGINLGKWPTTVTVQSVAGDPAETTFDELVQEVVVQQS